MAEYVTTTDALVALNGTIPFNSVSIPCNAGNVDPLAVGILNLRGKTCNRFARYNDGMEQNGYSGRRYSRDEGKANMISELQSLIADAPSQDERQVLQDAMRKLKQM